MNAIEEKFIYPSKSIEGKILIGAYSIPILSLIIVISANFPWEYFKAMAIWGGDSFMVKIFPNLEKAYKLHSRSATFIQNYLIIFNLIWIPIIIIAVPAAVRHVRQVGDMVVSSGARFFHVFFVVVMMLSAGVYGAYFYLEEELIFSVSLEKGLSLFIALHMASNWLIAVSVFFVSGAFYSLINLKGK